MRLAPILGFLVVMWALIMLGSFILLKLVSPIELPQGSFASSALQAVIAFALVIVWIEILVQIKNVYIRRKFV